MPVSYTICVQLCVQEGGFEGPENGPKQRRINNRLLSYRPHDREGELHTTASFYGVLACLATVHKSLKSLL